VLGGACRLGADLSIRAVRTMQINIIATPEETPQLSRDQSLADVDFR
jgi:hypothetical protein